MNANQKHKNYYYYYYYFYTFAIVACHRLTSCSSNLRYLLKQEDVHLPIPITMVSFAFKRNNVWAPPFLKEMPQKCFASMPIWVSLFRSRFTTHACEILFPMPSTKRGEEEDPYGRAARYALIAVKGQHLELLRKNKRSAPLRSTSVLVPIRCSTPPFSPTPAWP